MARSGWRRRRGFTLIEAMIVVVIVTLLALVAYVGYHRWIMSSAMAEGQHVVAGIRTTEENFFAENGMYLDVTGGLGSGTTYPSQHPGAFKTAWGGPCSWCVKQWDQLAINTDGPVFFGYSVVADSAVTPSGRGVAITVNSQAIDLSLMNGKPWYAIEADGDPDGDGKFVHLYAVSASGASSRIWVDGEGN
jgi:prepilin-type N-terminal cleavage/methylation domain-containing protein